jgi:hypothetical protein
MCADISIDCIDVKQFFDIIQISRKRNIFYSSFGRQWNQVFDSMTKNDKIIVSRYVSVDSFDLFARDVEQLIDTHAKLGYTVDKQGNKEWNQNGGPHRLDGPAIEYANGDKLWIQNCRLHRLGGPAVELADGTRMWIRDGYYHREGGPAIELPCGTKEWLQCGFPSRIDGPAVEFADGRKLYWIHGIRYSEEEYVKKVSKMKYAQMATNSVDSLHKRGE